MANLEKSVVNEKYAENFNPASFALIKHLCEQANASEHKLLVNELSMNFPEYREEVEALFEQCKFKQIEQLKIRLNANRKHAYSNLVALIAGMDVSTAPQKDTVVVQTLDQRLKDQEHAARLKTGIAPIKNNDTSNDQFELQSLKTMRESMKYFNVDKNIARAIEDFPENAGPHNPHMLAITSLMNMRDLSPQYLRRFAGYIETVLWLEKNEIRLNRKK